MLPGVGLALLMLWSVVQSLVVANWANGLEALVPVALPALLVGALFARFRWLPGWLAHLLSATLGFVWIVQALGSLMGDRLITWRDQATELIIRSIMLGRVLAGGGRGEDILLFVAALALLAWILGYATAWMLFRNGWIWRAVFLNAIVILTNYTYVLPKPTTLFFVFLGAALLLLVYQNIIARQELWRAAQVEYPDFMPLRFLAAAGMFCAVTILFTSLLPNRVSSVQVARAWETMSLPFTLARERWEDVFSTINAPPGVATGSFAARSAALGGARSLSDALVMYVSSPRFDYWRAIAFDRYTDGVWHNTTGEQARAALGASTPEQARTAFGPGAPIPPGADVRARAVVTQTVELLDDRKDDLITVGGRAMTVSLPTLVEHNYLAGSQSQLFANFDDMSLIVAQNTLRTGNVYTVTALVSVADEQSLRQAGTGYPDWVRERYLQLPNTVTERTRAQAQEIIAQAGASTPYDQALAIQNYLRTFPYNERIDAPPIGAEAVDYFLFDLQEGYCDYYASAMVVMLRSVGVPARWVRGYAGGYLDPELGKFVVRENVAHTWPEVYFPGFGWERFEPTPASYTALPDRPAMAANAGDEDEPVLGNVPLAPPSRFEDELEPGLEVDPATGAGAAAAAPLNERRDVQRQIAIGAVVIGMMGLAVYGLNLRWRYEVRGLRGATAAYAHLSLMARWAGLPQPPHATPYEYGMNLSRVLPQHRRSIGRLVDAYAAERYRGAPPTSRAFDAELKEIRRSLIERMFLRLGNLVRRAEPRER